MYDVGRKPTKIHVFAPHIFPVFSVCLDPLLFVNTGWVLPLGYRLKAVVGDSRKDFSSVKSRVVEFQDNIELEGITMRGSNFKYHQLS